MRFYNIYVCLSAYSHFEYLVMLRLTVALYGNIQHSFTDQLVLIMFKTYKAILLKQFFQENTSLTSTIHYSFFFCVDVRFFLNVLFRVLCNIDILIMGLFSLEVRQANPFSSCCSQTPQVVCFLLFGLVFFSDTRTRIVL